MHRNKREFTPILAVIPGKTEPENLDAYWQVMLDQMEVLLLSSSVNAAD